ncbi:MAG: GTP 3',8-cyclase MoaA [bacterium]
MTATGAPAPLSLRVSVTDRCSLRCRYCVPPEGHRRLSPRDILSFEEIVRLVQILKSYLSLTKIHLTGGEPLVRRNVEVLVEKLAAENLPDLALTTNGQHLLSAASRLWRAGLRRLNVSLDSLNPRTYRELTNGGELKPVLAGIEEALRLGFAPFKLNVVVLRGINDGEIEALARFGLKRGCTVRFLELMPIGPHAPRFQEWFVSSAEVSEKLAAAFELRPRAARAGGSSREYEARDGRGVEGVIGFISSHTEPFCEGCSRLRVTATGNLLGCLGREESVNLRPLLRENSPADSREVLKAVEFALRLKQKRRHFDQQSPMVAFGG